MDKNDFLQDYAVKVLIIWNYFACYNTTMVPSCILQKKKNNHSEGRRNMMLKKIGPNL